MTDATESEDVNVSKLRELAVRGSKYREDFETTYYGEDLTLQLRPMTDLEFLPIAAILEDKLDMSAEDAQAEIEDEREAGEDDSIDPSNFDTEFVKVMQRAAVTGIDTEAADAEGMDEDTLKETIAMLQGGVSLKIAERALDISSNAEKAESFRRDGGGS